jgi:hypothetical protein
MLKRADGPMYDGMHPQVGLSALQLQSPRTGSYPFVSDCQLCLLAAHWQVGGARGAPCAISARIHGRPWHCDSHIAAHACAIGCNCRLSSTPEHGCSLQIAAHSVGRSKSLFTSYCPSLYNKLSLLPCTALMPSPVPVLPFAACRHRAHLRGKAVGLPDGQGPRSPKRLLSQRRDAVGSYCACCVSVFQPLAA